MTKKEFMSKTVGEIVRDIAQEIISGDHDLFESDGILDECFIEELIIDNYRERLVGPIVESVCNTIKEML